MTVEGALQNAFGGRRTPLQSIREGHELAVPGKPERSVARILAPGTRFNDREGLIDRDISQFLRNSAGPANGQCPYHGRLA